MFIIGSLNAFLGLEAILNDETSSSWAVEGGTSLDIMLWSGSIRPGSIIALTGVGLPRLETRPRALPQGLLRLLSM